MTLKSELNCLIYSADVPDSGIKKSIFATAKDCRDLAKMPGVNSFSHVEAHFEITRWHKNGLKITADISAEVVQSCVVSLETVISGLNEQTQWYFKPDAPLQKNVDIDAALQIDPLGVDPADPLVDGKVDLGHLLAEHLCLMIDPFKRSTTVEFDTFYPQVQKSSEQKISSTSPFAKLQQLRIDGKN